MILDKGLIWSILIASVFADVELSKDLIERKKQIDLKCGRENNFEEEDYKQDFHKIELSKDLSEKHLCFLKCFYQTDGAIDEKGFLIFERVDEILSMMKLNDEDKKKITTCLKKTKAVNKCTDLIPLTKCFTRKESSMN
ncbi:hypothetical protein WA026_019827 [Henosepilachna vigintioctopunctata]|uniref:Uncharacterized protein n=1 Tax=Henosepilachna vigintioctopunctata TaxID=420089 RepID=A0AAW1VCE0_9CUCU